MPSGTFESQMVGPNALRRPLPLLEGDFQAEYVTDADDNKIPVLGYKIWDRDAALRPLDSFEMYRASVLWTDTESSANTWDDVVPFTLATEDDHIRGEITADIILSHNDAHFQRRFLVATQPKPPDWDEEANGPWIPRRGDYSAWGGIAGNCTSENLWKCFARYYRIANEDGFIHDMVNRLKSMPIIGYDIGTGSDFSTVIPPLFEFMLKQCFVWVRAGFFADYIDYRDFDQSLNKDASVIHENLMLGKSGDWRRYNVIFPESLIGAQSKWLARNTRPYLPFTTPSKDVIRDSLYRTNPNLSLDENMRNIIEYADDPNSQIGSLAIEPLERTQDEPPLTPPFTAGSLNAPPPIWFDPESRRNETAYSDFPIIVPKKGNLHIEGRVISPSIDEIWQMLKEIVAGRRADSVIPTEAGYPIGEGKLATKTDTRPSIRKHEFAPALNEDTVIGDPIKMDYRLDDPQPHYSVESWVNDPSRIVFNRLVRITDLVNQIGAINPVDPEAIMPTEQPMSLRELEAAIRGVMWNLELHVAYLELNAVQAGPLGRPNAAPIEETWNTNAGTQYQLHRLYDARTNNGIPNTAYDANYNTWETEAQSNGLGPIQESKGPIPSWSVYMGADGEWHSSAQRMLIPIRVDELW